jgi:hypothetical protein
LNLPDFLWHLRCSFLFTEKKGRIMGQIGHCLLILLGTFILNVAVAQTTDQAGTGAKTPPKSSKEVEKKVQMAKKNKIIVIERRHPSGLPDPKKTGISPAGNDSPAIPGVGTGGSGSNANQSGYPEQQRIL